ncbi:protein of unknown function DUF159 [Desulfatibacillum aliphaticivorans]|uniref:Abasic site processing protein n=1 Tax=Desulfatibacillum aliphaticivorans TaxID=218208 RepID=B8F978_DESAL|nr:SOS response-associated peptidase [Desulfatibacillum aliphaticivorans]ACL02824.1 protein of unknown function DUF159 [Desulfatibacillum aliphaticivorans]
MCGRFLQFWFEGDDLESLGVKEKPENFTPSYNVAPTQKAWVIIHDKASRLEAFSWGLVPSWAKDAAGAARLINARSETAAEKPSFRSAFKKRRCLVPANGFYEWTGGKGAKQPYYCSPAPKKMIAYAGLWEVWKPREAPSDSQALHSFTILTREADASFAPIHHRMPVILQPQAWASWLDPQNQNPGELNNLLENNFMGEIQTWPVSKAVNSPSHNDPNCMAPIELEKTAPPKQQTLF